jgi:HD-GYP domain-containing protein (c-di-GMP phosphodiesterase class II)
MNEQPPPSPGDASKADTPFPAGGGEGLLLRWAWSLVRALERKDSVTAAHTWRVTLYTRALAEADGADRDTIDRLTVGAALHDIGKLDIPDRVLLKPGPLTDDEFALMRRHPVLGHDRLLRLGVDDELVLALVRSHHERLDGGGYPDGLAGTAIPRAAAYFAVVDSFDAMTSVRPYRLEISDNAAGRAIFELRALAGSQYCPQSVELFVTLHDGGGLDWIMRHFNDSCPVPDFLDRSGAA